MVHRPAHRTGLAFLQIGRQHARAPRTLQLLQPLQRRRIGIVVRFRVFQAAQRLLMRPFRKCRRARQLGATVDHLLRIALRRLGTLDRRMRLLASIRQHACRLVHLRLRGIEAPLRFSLAHFRIRQLFDR